MKTIVYSLYHHPLAQSISHSLQFTQGHCQLRSFPDGETYLRITDDVRGKKLILIDSLDRPDQKIMPLLYFAKTAKDLGASEIQLIAPYLAYMRQDKQFFPGECLSSRYFAELLSSAFDSLITIDPHLHRYKSLNEIYTIPTQVEHATNAIASWLQQTINQPLLIGPDKESKQWVSSLAKQIACPYLVLDKIRISDVEVKISIPDINQYNHPSYTPILVDDIISSGHTMIEACNHFINTKLQKPIAIAVHALFSNATYAQLSQANIDRIITSNSITHETNTIDMTSTLAQAIINEDL